MTTTKEKTYRLRKIMDKWHVGIYEADKLVDDHAFMLYASAKQYAEGLDIRDGDRG